MTALMDFDARISREHFADQYRPVPARAELRDQGLRRSLGQCDQQSARCLRIEQQLFLLRTELSAQLERARGVLAVAHRTSRGDAGASQLFESRVNRQG